MTDLPDDRNHPADISGNPAHDMSDTEAIASNPALIMTNLPDAMNDPEGITSNPADDMSDT